MLQNASKPSDLKQAVRGAWRHRILGALLRGSFAQRRKRGRHQERIDCLLEYDIFGAAVCDRG